MTDTISLGQRLKTAREALGFTLEDVAQKTNLKRNHIESLENDIFILQNVPPAFVRGYVRNYVRFLRLPEDLIGSVNYGEVTIPKEVKKAEPIKVSNHKSQGRWVKLLTWLILLAAVGMTLAWWWQEHKKEEVSREALVSNTEIVAAQPSTAPQAVEIPLQNANSVSTSTPVSAESPAPAIDPQPVSTATAPEQVAAPTVAPAVEQTPAAVVVPVAEAAPQPAAPAATSEPTVQPATTETPTTEQPAATGNDELRIEITGAQSWITVRSVKAKRSLAEKLYNSGEVLTFNGNEQYRLTIGAPANVKVYYKGQEVPLKVDGRVARIKLPQ